MTEKEQQFLQYWEASREKEGKWQHQLLLGIPMGLLFSLPILLILITGRFWYMRAEAVANTMVSPYILVLAVFGIAVFFAFFYKRFQWERKEQYYQELKAKARQENAGKDPVQL